MMVPRNDRPGAVPWLRSSDTNTMPDPSPALALLHAIRADLDRLEAALTGQPVAASGARPNATPPADDSDLDGQYGDPTVRKDPRDWKGQSYVGAKFSDCPPDYLEMLAGLLDWQAGKSDEKNEMANNGKPRSGYLKRDAARARGWAKRNATKAAGRPAARPKPATMNDPDEAPDLDDAVPF